MPRFGSSARTALILAPCVLLTACLLPPRLQGVEFPGAAPGPARAAILKGQLVMQNAALRAVWNLMPGRMGLVELANRLDGRTVRAGPAALFRLVAADGRAISSSQLRLAGKPQLRRIAPRPGAVRAAERAAGWTATASFASGDGLYEAVWQATLRDGSNYVRQEVAWRKYGVAAPAKIVPLDFTGAEASPAGEVDGSPLLAGNLFFACEHPMAKNRLEDKAVACSVPVFSPRPGDSPRASAVLGVAPPDQMRRAFLYYLERERARPYSPFVNYISWFDIAAPGLKMTQEQCLDVIHSFGRELAARRGARVNGFVFDDGWDDNTTLWRFHSGFPDGFSPLSKAAAGYGAVLGTWISPWGGYGKHKTERVEFGRKQGFETNRAGLSLASPRYYERFREVCVEMIRRYGVGYFKFDGIGSGIFATGPGAGYEADLSAMLRLIDDLRAVRPDLFVNATVGTWPSPYWLFHSDTVWRGGEDVAYAGAGTKRQQWMTYRDKLGYRTRTRRGPLFPFNSLKFQSVMCARLSLAAQLNRDKQDLLDDIHMAAASGTQLQEFFVTPAMLEPWGWDAIAEAAGWVQRNAEVLADSHGIGGDPERGEVYGFASWSPRLGVIALRNPSARPAEFMLDPGPAFELPAGAPQRFATRTLWGRPGAPPEMKIEAGRPRAVALGPFEVLVFEAAPE